jgi:hypothetical protein
VGERSWNILSRRVIIGFSSGKVNNPPETSDRTVSLLLGSETWVFKTTVRDVSAERVYYQRFEKNSISFAYMPRLNIKLDISVESAE